MQTQPIIISSAALNEHMERLYDLTQCDNGSYCHVEGSQSGVIQIISERDTSATIAMSESAVREFILDMEYQIEFNDERYQLAYRNQCKRALTSLCKQLNIPIRK